MRGIELRGSIGQVRTALEELAVRDARNDGRRWLFSLGAVASLAGAYGWTIYQLPGLVPARVVMALVLTVCTVMVIRLSSSNFDKAKIQLLHRVLHAMRSAPGVGEISVRANLKPLDFDDEALLDTRSRLSFTSLKVTDVSLSVQDWLTVDAELAGATLKLDAQRVGFQERNSGERGTSLSGRLEADKLTFELRAEEPEALKAVSQALQSTPHHEVSECVLRDGVLRVTLEEAPRDAATESTAPILWMEWYARHLAALAW